MGDEKKIEVDKKYVEELDGAIEKLSKPGFQIDDELLQDFRELSSRSTHQLVWAPAIGCGAAIIALANIIANVPSPDTALDALTIPMGAISVGLACGVVSAYLYVDIWDGIASAPKNTDKAKQDIVNLAKEASELSKGLTIENHASRMKRAEEMAKEGEEARRRYEKASGKIKALSIKHLVARIVAAVSMSAIALGLGFLLLGHELRLLWLERPLHRDPAAKAAFNLACAGSTTSGVDNGRITTTPFNRVIRIDLRANRWCSDECKETKPISSVSETEIVLGPVPREPVPFSYDALRISRESGRMDGDLHVGKWEAVSMGSCTRAPFTGFPARMF